MKWRKYVKPLFGMLSVALALLIGWSLAFWITSNMYEATSFQPNEWARQLITAFLGFFFFGFSMFFITNIKWVKDRQEKMVHPMIHAMKMMAEGNFNIDLSFYRDQSFGRGNHPYSQIVSSIYHMADKLGEMEEMRQEFISNISHEIQSPLTSISGFAHALKMEDLSPEKRAHYLDIIELESIRLSKISENLLKLTSLESENLNLDRTHYRLDHQLRRIILANEPQWIEKDIHMDIDLDHVTVDADEDLMDQVWTNLLHNSIKFTEQGGTLTVTGFRTEEGKAVVRMKDTGIGMDQDSLMHIFERFYKADKSRNRKSGGSGLGLAIVKKIVDLHEGSIQVKSEEGVGTEFVVTL